MSKSPAFQYYPKDLLSDAKVMAMSLEEFGAYWKLVSICWVEGSLPADVAQLARLLHVTPKKMTGMWGAIAPCFVVDGDRLLHPRLEVERQKQAENREKKQHAAEERWKRVESKRNAGALQVECPSSASSSATAVNASPAAPDGAPEPDPGAKKSRKRPSSGQPAVPSPTRGGWAGEAHALWVQEIGEVTAGNVGRWLKPAVERYGWPEIEKAMREYAWRTEGQKRSPKYFADDIVRWMREASEPLVDPQTGWLTPKGERVTRPAA